MSGPSVIYATAAVSAALSLALWIMLARLLRRGGRSPWRAAPLGALLLLAAVGYGLYWFAFFSSPSLAVPLHLLRLKLVQKLGGLTPFLALGGLLLAALPLLRPKMSRNPAA